MGNVFAVRARYFWGRCFVFAHKSPGLFLVSIARRHMNHPAKLFLVQSTTTAVLGTSTIGLNIGFASSLQASGNTTTGISGLALNSSTVGSSATLPFRIVDTSSSFAPPGTNGADGTTAGTIMVVGFNNEGRRALTQTS